MRELGYLILAICISVVEGYPQQRNNFFLYPTDTASVYGICFTNHGGALGIADGTSVKVYSTATHTIMGRFVHGHRKQILSIDISIDSTLLISGGKDSTAVLWNLHNGQQLERLRVGGMVTAVALSGDSRYAALGCTDHTVSLYDINKKQIVQVFDGHRDDVTSVAFSPNGKYLASASGDKTINVYELEDHTLVNTLRGHRNWVRDMSFSKDGMRLVSCGDDGRIITWDIADAANAETQAVARRAAGWLLSIDLLENSSAYAVGSFGGDITIVLDFGSYQANLRSPITKLLLSSGKGGSIRVAAATRDKGVYLIDAADMKSPMVKKKR